MEPKQQERHFPNTTNFSIAQCGMNILWYWNTYIIAAYKTEPRWAHDSSATCKPVGGMASAWEAEKTWWEKV